MRHRGPVGGDGLPAAIKYARVKPIRDENGLAVDLKSTVNIRSTATTTSA